MNEKITLPVLTQLLALHTGDSRKQSEDFIKEFFGAISAALANGEQVKIKDFGAFKTTLVGARKSVNVSTGEDHEIPAHYKVSFTPSKEIAAIINEPFEMFETVELNDNVSLDDLETIDQADPDDAPDQPNPESEQPEPEPNPESEQPEPEPNPESEQPEPEPNHSEQPEADNSPLYVFDDSDSDLSKPSDDDNKSSDDEDASSDDETITPDDEKTSSIVCEDFSPVDEETSPVDEDSSVDVETSPKPAKGRFWLGFLVGFAAAFFVAFIIYGTFLYIGDSQSLHTNQVQTPSAVTADAKSSADPATDQSVAAQKANQSAESDQPKVEQKATETPEVNTRPSDSPLYDTITKTRYLTTMAKDHYGNYHLWPYIYMENQKFLGHPDRITPGTKVVVPPLSKYGVDPSNPEHIKKAKQLGIEIYKKYQ